jgi:hypothetical protein
VRVAPYEVVAPFSRLAAFHSASKRERKSLLLFFDKLARQPSLETEWTLIDHTGRTNFQIAVGRFLVTYWPDHAVREIRIVRLELID